MARRCCWRCGCSHTFDSALPIAIYIILGAVVTGIATVLLPEPSREAVERELDEGVRRPVPEAARASERRVAVLSS